jgi:hypothetical protein
VLVAVVVDEVELDSKEEALVEMEEALVEIELEIAGVV